MIFSLKIDEIQHKNMAYQAIKTRYKSTFQLENSTNRSRKQEKHGNKEKNLTKAFDWDAMASANGKRSPESEDSFEAEFCGFGSDWRVWIR